jgi:hypothetical protein
MIHKIPLQAAIVCLVLCMLPAHTHPITWCHDYSYYQATGRDANKTGPDELRKTLSGLGYKRFPFTNAAHLPQAQGRLRPGDVIIIGDAHSGVVNRDGLIDHFIQVFGASGTAYQPGEILSMPNFKRGWTLIQMMNFTRTTPDGRRIQPYKDKQVEVWRRQK